MSYVEALFGIDAFSTPKAEYIDRSDLEAFGICPLQGQLRKQHEGEYETHDPLPEAAKIVHSIGAVAIKSCNRDLQEAADYIANELPKARPDLQPDVLRAGRFLANRLRWSRARHVLMADDEQISRTIIPASKNRGELIVTTRPDLVLATDKPDKIVIADTKAGWKDRTNQEARDEFQTCTICWTIKGKFPHIRYIDFNYWQTRKNTIARAYIDLEQVVGGTQKEPLTQELAFEQRIFEAARLYIEGVDDAWPNETKCSMCPVLKWCKYAEEVCKELDGDIEGYVDNTVVLAEVLKQREKAISEATKDGRILYGSGGYFDDSPKKKSPRRVSFKAQKENKTET